MSQQQASVPVSPLRRRMLDDRAIRSLHEDTQRNYIKSVRNFAAFLGRSPETATPEDVRRFQIHQADSGVQPPTVNNAMSGLRFLLNVTLDRPDLSRRLVLVRYAQKLPTVLNVEDAGRLLEAARGLKDWTALGMAYGAGLRVSEVVGLRTGDIDSTRMLIRVEQGKGRKDRNAMLSPQLLELLRPCTDGEPDEGAVTWHGMPQHRAKATPLRPSDTLALTASGTVPSKPGTAPSACRHRRRTSIAAPADRSHASSGHGFANLDRPQRLRALDPPNKSP